MLKNYFEAFDLAPGPVLDAEALKSDFQKRSARLHPDASGGSEEAFRALHDAFQTLHDPARRLRHLLKLTAPEQIERSSAPPPEVAELFLPVGAVLQRLAAIKKKDEAAGSPLAKALLAPEKMALMEELQQMLSAVEGSRAQALTELESLVPAWMEPENLPRLSRLQQRLVFHGKWAAQLREGLLQLDF